MRSPNGGCCSISDDLSCSYIEKQSSSDDVHTLAFQVLQERYLVLGFVEGKCMIKTRKQGNKEHILMHLLSPILYFYMEA